MMTRHAAVLPSLASKEVSFVQTEETLVTDIRAGMSSAELIERKLRGLLKQNPLPLSQLRQQSTSSRRPG
ncbi:MAG: hypothetical protein NZ700_10080 [Gemmataceae bacterium]|nr:hypothetical protein [Gemmataceae bacterium]MDW8264029.1 hypothetical protein [Gemmataceae bacterium]